MKKILSKITLAGLTVALLGSCSKINERIDNLEKRVDGIGSEKIASIENQIAGIRTSIADLGTIRSDIQALQTSSAEQSREIIALKAVDESVGNRMDDLEEYIGTLTDPYATKDWVETTFTSLEQYEETCDTLAAIIARVSGLDKKLSEDIKACTDSMKNWVNVQLDAYYTAAEMDVRLKAIQKEIDSVGEAGAEVARKVAALAVEINVEKVKTEIKAECRAVVSNAINSYEGTVTAELQSKLSATKSTVSGLQAKVTAMEKDVKTLKEQVAAMEGMIQTVSVIPAYGNGSVKIEDDTLYLNSVISPKEAISNLKKENFTVILNEVPSTNAAGFKEITITDDAWFIGADAEEGTVEFKIPVKEYLPESDETTLTVALSVKTGISDVTSEFVKVTVAVPEPLPGEFTVNADGKKVQFSRGNLYYNGRAFKFEPNQYEIKFSWDASHVSHFYWSKSASVAYAETYSDGSATGSDVFFTNAEAETAKSDFTVSGVAGEYRTLSTAEWQYLINKNNDENIRKGKYKYGVTVCEKANCLILVPDECLNGYSFDNTKTSYSIEDGQLPRPRVSSAFPLRVAAMSPMSANSTKASIGRLLQTARTARTTWASIVKASVLTTAAIAISRSVSAS